MKISEILIITLSNTKFWGLILVAFTVIILGFVFEKQKLLSANWEKIIVKITIIIGLPAMILKNFMIDLNQKNFNQFLILLTAGLIFYLLITLIVHGCYIKTSRPTQDVLIACGVCPSVFYFGYPLAMILVKPEEMLILKESANLFNIGFWIFLCFYALYLYQRQNDTQKYLVQENQKLWKKIMIKTLCSPIIIALFLGLILWLMQIIPGIKIIHVTRYGWNTVDDGVYSVTRLDALIPGFNQATTILGALPTPLAWLAIGALAAKRQSKNFWMDKKVWSAALVKMLLVPGLTLVFLIFIAYLGQKNPFFKINRVSLLVIVLMNSSPTATAMASYGVIYHKEAKLSAEICILTTCLALFLLPFWTVVSSLISNHSLFN